MKKLTGGEGWSLSSDEEPKPVVKPNPKSPKPKVKLEKRSGGKVVTSVSGLHTFGANRLNAMAKELKSKCGTGGTVKNGVIEIQGNKLTQVEEWIQKYLSK